MEASMISVPITAFYGGLLAAVYVYLSFAVIFKRRKHMIGIGDGGKKDLSQAIRVHGNFMEYVPFAVILMLIAEINQMPHTLLHIVGAGLIIVRLLHAFGLANNVGKSWQRFVGVIGTFLLYIVLIVTNILTVY
ncbi:MAPEG family protein [Alteromonas sp. a30]|uniref:MAPEG family protein n=1 Tax=Alteromonas sp. a30 TaxID=2730917 RepID=UPI002280E8A1|nr:MAPEG family protein [Alteromonas sp. a30]